MHSSAAYIVGRLANVAEWWYVCREPATARSWNSWLLARHSSHL